MAPKEIKTYKCSDINKILLVEHQSFVEEIRASREIIEKRLKLLHTYICCEYQGKVAGTIAFHLDRFDPENKKDFPKTFNEYSGSANNPDANALFVYSLGVVPEFRDGRVAKSLIKSVSEEAAKSGLEFIVGDGRCPSYNGSCKEGISQIIKFKELIDNYVKTSHVPEKNEFLLDPLLAFYHKIIGCKFAWIFPKFIPEDAASGGFRVIGYKEIK